MGLKIDENWKMGIFTGILIGLLFGFVLGIIFTLHEIKESALEALRNVHIEHLEFSFNETRLVEYAFEKVKQENPDWNNT